MMRTAMLQAVLAVALIPVSAQADPVTYAVEGVINFSIEPLLPVGTSYSATLTFDPSTLVTSSDAFGGTRYSAGCFVVSTGPIFLSGPVSITIDSAHDWIRIDHVGGLAGSFPAGLRINLIGSGLSSDAFPDPFPVLSDFAGTKQIVINTSGSTTGSVTLFEPVAVTGGPVLYNTFGACERFSSTFSYSVDGNSTFQAFRFVPTATGVLGEITVALGRTGAAQSSTVFNLYDGPSSTALGALIESFVVPNVATPDATSPFTPTVATAVSILNPTLIAGQGYWLSISEPQAANGAFSLWMNNSVGASGTRLTNLLPAATVPLPAFRVHATTVPELLSDLISDVLALNLQAGIANSFDAKLNVVIEALGNQKQGDDVAAVNALHAFINAVEAQRGGRLSDAQADSLVSSAQAIIGALTSGVI